MAPSLTKTIEANNKALSKCPRLCSQRDGAN